MKDTWELNTEELLFELGYDGRKELDREGVHMAAFMREVRRETLKEAQRYIDELEDCEDDYYIELKNINVK